MTRAIVIGFGSAGRRHAEILKNLGCDVGVVSRNPASGYRTHQSVSEAAEDGKFDYAIIANETSAHERAVADLIAAGFKGKVLVEKPLGFRCEAGAGDRFELAALGYNLRFHPVLDALSRALQSEKMISMQVYCGQYLPSWRPSTDYRTSYSARAASGGGVLRDLSHELDYIVWLAGQCKSVAALGGRLGQLEIDSDDCWAMLMKFERCPIVTLEINYFDKPGRRTIVVQTANHTFSADLLAATLTRDGVVEKFDVKGSDTYIAQHEAVLAGDTSRLCSFQDGDRVMGLIEAVETSANSNSWISL